MIVHDHFDGSAYCRECGGKCQLSQDEQAETAVVRYLLEWCARSSPACWMPMMLHSAMEKMLGSARLRELKERAIATSER